MSQLRHHLHSNRGQVDVIIKTRLDHFFPSRDGLFVFVGLDACVQLVAGLNYTLKTQGKWSVSGQDPDIRNTQPPT
jgi:hypothetical protein